MKRTILVGFIALTSWLFTQPAHALLISVSGGGEIIATPNSVTIDNLGIINNHQQGFNERQNIKLALDLLVDNGATYSNTISNSTGPYISAGTTVSSHMIFLRPELLYDTNGQKIRTMSYNVSWVFSDTILGVMSDSWAQYEAMSSATLGAVGTVYSGAYKARGFESKDIFPSSPDFYTISGNTLNVSMRASAPGDFIRVITAGTIPPIPPKPPITSVPEPSTLLLLGSGLAGLGFVRKRFKA